ncbi:MAG: UDP-N-acetylmuramoyl-tripeptide--D-alanyl-D-alanine ligase [Flavobacteriales bacterium]
MLAITGSNGKTTTKELVHAVLAADRRTLATVGNLNNHIGVPLTLLRIKTEHAFAIIEMGANKPGDIDELMRIAEPTHGLITNIGKAHLEGFGSLEGVVRTKTELYRWLKAHGGQVFVNGDDPLLTEKASACAQRFTYGAANGSNCQGGLLESDSCLSFWFRSTKGEHVEVRTRLIGSYNLPNALAAVAVGQMFGVPDALIATALEGYSPGNNRSQWKETGSNQLVLDAYNANPTSVEAALRHFAHLHAAKPKLAILGDMLELGQEANAEHQRIAALCIELGLESIFVGPAHAAAGAPNAFDSLESLMDSWKGGAPKGRVILLKGSRGMQLERLEPML